MSAELKTIKLNLDKEQELEGFASAIKKEKIKIGREPFNVKIFVSHSMTESVYGTVLLYLATIFTKEMEESFTNKKTDIAYYNKLNNQFYIVYAKYHDARKLENSIEKEFKLNIELEKRTPLDEVFGIWKNEDISLEKIRRKAWQRNS